MHGAETTLAERTLATLLELRAEQSPRLEYLDVLIRAIAPQVGIKYLNEISADKRAAACRAITSLTQRLRQGESDLKAIGDDAALAEQQVIFQCRDLDQLPFDASAADSMWDQAIAQTRAWIAAIDFGQ
jgi:hypothetical protein